MNRYTGVVLLLLSTILFQEAYTQNATLTGGGMVMESVGSTPICVTLDSSPESEGVNIVLETDDTPNSAQAGLDYESLNQVLTFPANTTILTQCVNITILQDSAVESFVEFFNVLANSTSISVTPASVMILIQEDNDQLMIGFEQASYTAQEGAPVQVCAVILEGSVEQVSGVTFTFGAQDGTAGSDDYTLSMPNSAFQMGETRACTNIAIPEDTIVEVTETFTVTLTGTAVVVNSTARMATVSIEDNDGVTVAVSMQGPNPVTEPGNNGTSTNLMVCASVSSSPGDIERDTVVRVSSTEGTAGTGDFQPLSDQIIIPFTAALNTLVCQNITILGDTVEEDEENFTVTASVTSPDTITQPDTFTVTIVDDGDVADCGSPPVVENAGQTESGRRNPGGGASLGTTVTYTCITGYVISGESTRTCQADSTWSGFPPTCERLTIGFEQASYTAQEGTPLEVCAVILGGSVERVGGVPFTFGAQDGTAGDMDYTLLMQTSTFQMGETRVCRNITIQEDTIAEVTETFTVTLTGNSEMFVSSDASNATVSIADNNGFTVTVSLQGPNPVTEPGNDGTSTNLMLCASVSSSPGITVARDTVVRVSSTEGTAGTGDFQPLSDQIIIPSTAALNTLVCQNITILEDTVEEEDETFTVRAFATIPDTITQPDTFTVTIVDDGDVADCGSPPVVENAGQTESGRRNPGGGASLGTTVMYTCITGYVISGESTRTCQADSTWSGSPPTCERVVCPDLENPQNGAVILSDDTVFGSQATYTCNDGFVILSGNDTRTCEANGQWSGTIPTCGVPASPTTEGVGGLSDRDRTIAIAVPTAVVGAILLLVVIILIIMIAVHCRKKRHSQKYVLNYHTVYGNQQTTPAPSSNRAEASSPESDREENQSPSIEDGYNTANTFKGNPPGEQNKTSIVNEDAEN